MKPWHKKIIFAGVAVLALVFLFWLGGGAPGTRGWDVGTKDPAGTTPDGKTLAPDEKDPSAEAPKDSDGEDSPSSVNQPDKTEEDPTAKPEPPEGGEGSDPAFDQKPDQYQTDPVPEGKPEPEEPQEAEVTDKADTCTLSVTCSSILENMDWLDPAKTDLVPADGVIFPKTEVTFYEGESVFQVLRREMKKAKIHMEFSTSPIYNSAYLEGIHNLYEFDCGELSGWLFRVNGWFPNYGCSRYALKDGDVVEWIYTCDYTAEEGALLGGEE